MTNKEALEMIKNDVVIVRNDGRIIQDQLGNIETFPPTYDYATVKGKIRTLMLIVEKLNLPYTYSFVKYTDLPQDKKY